MDGIPPCKVSQMKPGSASLSTKEYLDLHFSGCSTAVAMHLDLVRALHRFRKWSSSHFTLGSEQDGDEEVMHAALGDTRPVAQWSQTPCCQCLSSSPDGK